MMFAAGGKKACRRAWIDGQQTQTGSTNKALKQSKKVVDTAGLARRICAHFCYKMQ
jgi:hypothetical protein